MSKSFWLLSAGITALATPAYAQPTTPPATTGSAAAAAVQNDNGQTEIVVTAQGRRQVLEDVPIAVTAVGGDALRNSGATDIRQLNQLAPSLLVSSTGTEANGSARIRGIGTVGDNPGLESSVAVFIDGVYRSRSGIGLNELGEVERIEVLRGPQGTLFGRNASAGLISIITRRPDFTFGGSGEISYGNYNAVRAAMGITGPLSQQVAFRIDGIYSRRDGFYRVVNPQGGTEGDVNDRNRFFVRGQLLFEPSDAVSIRLIGDYTWRSESCCGAVYVGTRETFDPTPGTPGDFSVAASNRIVSVLTSLGGILPSAGNPYNRLISVSPGRTYRGTTTDWGGSGQIDWHLGGGTTLTSITAYRRYKSEAPGDVDYNNVDILYRPNDGNAFRQFNTFTQELRLQGSVGHTLDWLIGGYYANEDLHVRDNLTFGTQYGEFAACRLVATISAAIPRDPTSPGCSNAITRATLAGALGGAAPIIQAGLDRLSTVNNLGDNNANYFQNSTNWAVFTHNIINIFDTLSLTLGARYTHESKDFSANFSNSNTICPTQQAFFAPFLTGGAAALPASLQALAAGVVNLTCQGNSSSALNALQLRDRRSEGEWTGTGILAWKPSTELMIYASYARGYKAGGFNLDRSALGQPIFAPNDPRQFGGRAAGFGTANLQFDPETVNSWEVGFKWTQPHFVLNVAAFHERFSNFQLNTFNGSVFLVQNINGCSASLGTTDGDVSNPPTAANATGACPASSVGWGVQSTGVEVEMALYPVRNLQFTMGFTYANTRYRGDLVGRDTGTPLDSALFLLPGSPLSNAPKYTATASASWTPPIPGTNLSALFYADARLTSDYNTGSDLFPEKIQDSYALVNARIGLRGPQQHWSIELWAQNLFNQNYQQVAFAAPFQGSNTVAQITTGNGGGGSPMFSTANQLFASFLAEPRTYGVTARFRF